MPSSTIAVITTIAATSVPHRHGTRPNDAAASEGRGLTWQQERRSAKRRQKRREAGAGRPPYYREQYRNAGAERRRSQRQHDADAGLLTRIGGRSDCQLWSDCITEILKCGCSRRTDGSTLMRLLSDNGRSSIATPTPDDIITTQMLSVGSSSSSSTCSLRGQTARLCLRGSRQLPCQSTAVGRREYNCC